MSINRANIYMGRRLFLFPAVAFALFISACRSSESDAVAAEFVPHKPDYASAEMWHIERNDAGDGADIFYIPSTWEYDWISDDGVTVSHYADPSKEEHRANMDIEISKIAGYMAEDNNFYSPYYRHITLDSWATLNEDTISRRYRDVAFVDIENAFSYYLDNFNNGRPFVLAGFSQGGKSVVELMKAMPVKVRERMIAAYVLGYKVTPDDVVAAPWIAAAEGPDDTGVTICYNSVSDVKYVKPVVSSPNVMCINPVNWRTDPTPATLNDTITVTLDPEYNVLVLDGFDGSYLPNILNILNVGDYHGIEPWLYSDCLAANIKLRIHSWKKSHGQ